MTAPDQAYAEIQKLVQRFKSLSATESALDDQRFILQKRIEQVDAEIDRRVYALCGLTEEEIKVVEGKV